MNALITARGLRFSYGQRAVLDSVDAELQAGELLIVIGPNGSGKTTLVRALSGVILADARELSIAGTPLVRLQRRDIARRLAVMPQETAVPFPYSVREMIAMGRAPWLGPLGREGASDRDIVDAALAELGLVAFAGRDYTSLSGGEKQRVLLARALAQNAPAWLLDEPTAHMDLGHRLQTFAWLRDWIGAEPEMRAVLLVTHDLALAARFADRVLLLAGGRVAAQGPPVEVFTPERIRDVYRVEARIEPGADGRLRIEPLHTLSDSFLARG